jgi:hypothetical protein
MFGLAMFASCIMMLIGLLSCAWIHYIYARAELACGLFQCTTRFPGYEKVDSLSGFAETGGSEDRQLYNASSATAAFLMIAFLVAMGTGFEVLLLRRSKLAARYERFLSVQALSAGFFSLLAVIVYGAARPTKSNDFTPYAQTSLWYGFYCTLAGSLLSLAAFVVRKYNLFVRREVLPH